MKGISQKRSMLFLVQLPPPVHGVSVINQLIWEDDQLWEGWDRDLLELRFSKKTSQLRHPGILKAFRFVAIWFRLLAYCLTRRYQYAYFSIIPVSVGFYRDLCYALLIKAFGIKPVYHIHLSGIQKARRKRLNRLLYEWIFSNAIIIHPSEKICRREFDDLTLRDTRIYIQPNGINESSGTEKPSPDISGRELRIIHMSHLYRFKGLEILLAVFNELVSEGYDLYLDIVGDKAEKSVYRTILNYQDNPVTKERIKWHGLLTGPSKWDILRKADIFVHTSTIDTFPLVILEGMKSGLPIISADVGGIPEMLEHERSGLLFEAGNKDLLKENLKRLIASHDLRRTLGQNARGRYAAKYTYQHFRSGMLNIFKGL